MGEPAFAQPEDPENFGAFDDGVEGDDEFAPRRKFSLPPIGPMVPMLGASGGGLLIGVMLGFGTALLMNWLFAPGPELIEEPEVAAVSQPLDPITVNLRGEDHRTVRIAAVVDVETIDPDRVTHWAPAMQDSLITLASDYTADELLSRPGRERFKGELRHRISLVLHDDVVSNLHFTELVVQ